jgi:hypothetical protein
MKTIEMLREEAIESLTKFHFELIKQSQSRWFFCSDLKQLFISQIESELRKIILAEGERAEKVKAAEYILAIAKEFSLIKLRMGFFSRNYNDTLTDAYLKLHALKIYLFQEHTDNGRDDSRYHQRIREIYGNTVPRYFRLTYPPTSTTDARSGNSDSASSSDTHEPILRDKKYGTIRII